MFWDGSRWVEDAIPHSDRLFALRLGTLVILVGASTLNTPMVVAGLGMWRFAMAVAKPPTDPPTIPPAARPHHSARGSAHHPAHECTDATADGATQRS